MKKNLRIAIIGAGISGLTAAHTLKKAGYDNIVIFEARDRVGGKVRTVKKDGFFYEMGGVFIQGDFKTIKSLFKAYEWSLTRKQALRTAIWENDRQSTNFSYARKKFGMYKTLKDFFRLSILLAKNKNLAQSDYLDTDSSMYRNFIDLAEDSDMQAVPFASAPFITGMGFGYVDSTPALYHLKLMKRCIGFAIGLELNSNIGMRVPVTYYAQNGYQMFMEKMSGDFDVRLNSKVQKIDRQCNGSGIKISTAEGNEIFDRLIISSPPFDTKKILDMSEEETRLHEKARNLFFRCTLFYGRDLPENKMFFFPNAAKTGRYGYPTCVVNFHPENNIFNGYQLHDGSLSAGQLDNLLHQTVRTMCGTLEDVVSQETFTYFTHYSEKDLHHLRPYERFTDLQGRNGVYFVGGALSGESVDDSARYAQRLIMEHFRK